MYRASDRDVLFEAFLNQHDTVHWDRVVRGLLSSIHPVDRHATEVWFAFYPLALNRALRSGDRAEVVRRLWLQGRFDIADQIDTSHRFLYAHRFWPAARSVLLDFVATGRPPASLDLGDLIRELSDATARTAGTDISLAIGITAIAVMTAQQVGLASLRGSAGTPVAPSHLMARSPDALVRARSRDDSQGMFGFLRGFATRYTVTWDEYDPAARFTLLNTQHLATAAQSDTRDHSRRDSRCHEGPIPVECRAAACGFCWVGVLAGAEKLSPVSARERERLREFGYATRDEPFPVIRLACQAQGSGNVTLVLSPWNGILGRRTGEPSVARRDAGSAPSCA